jgi:hypothetical protein
MATLWIPETKMVRPPLKPRKCYAVHGNMIQKEIILIICLWGLKGSQHFFSLFYKKTSPPGRVILLDNHPTVKTAKHDFKTLWEKWG